MVLGSGIVNENVYTAVVLYGFLNQLPANIFFADVALVTSIASPPYFLMMASVVFRIFFTRYNS